jgi:steroid delta-isomerase-like uncharacterized protein
MAQTDTAITQAAEQLIDAFNHDDWDRLRPLLAPDVVYAEAGTGRRIEGADAYFELLNGWKTALPDVNGTIRTALASNDTVAQELLWEGTHSGPMQTPGGTLEATGNHIRVDATAWFQFQDGLIHEIHHHLDVLTLLQQIGALPGPPQ